ncbi:hypothetical protein CDEST_15450 [Colletotrichum destructivum]|uniref:Uncharacterized protein n=1 Tax=Colletotrichum destructivum TaxID=34406 RepID=A0AAX4J4N7_9PEZI|nr:hypothetical protein CDEST_15450 [Colletotrichum destructivum]
MNTQAQSLTPTGSYSGETLVGHESPPASWSPSYSVASTLADTPGHGPETGHEDVESTGPAAVRAWQRSSFVGHAPPSEALDTDGFGIRPDTANTTSTTSTVEEQRRELSLTPRTSTSDITLVGSPTNSWSSGQTTIALSPEGDLIEAMRGHHEDQDEISCRAGVSVPAAIPRS